MSDATCVLTPIPLTLIILVLLISYDSVTCNFKKCVLLIIVVVILIYLSFINSNKIDNNKKLIYIQNILDL